MIYKNTASQKLAVFAYTASTGAAKTGDAAQITSYVSIDWAAAGAVTDTNPTEMDSTNMPGWYVFDLTQAETNGEVLVFAPKSSTSGVVLDQVQVFTQATATPTAAAVADAVWDEASTGHTDAGKAGQQLWTDIDAILADTGTDGVVLAADAITAAKIADDAISTEHIATGALTADSFATDSIAAAAVAAATVTKIQSGLATATALTTVDDLVDDLETRLTATRAGYLDNLSAGAVATATAVADLPTNAELASALAAADDAVLAAIAALENLSSAGAQAAAEAALAAYDAATASDVPTANANADALLKRDWTAVTGEAARSALNALRFLRNKWSISGTTLTVTKEDDSAAAWTAALTTAASTDGITAVDPA